MIRQRHSLRNVAETIVYLRMVEERLIHANRDNCMSCGIIGTVTGKMAFSSLPKKYRESPDWVHNKITAPATRTFARREFEDE